MCSFPHIGLFDHSHRFEPDALLAGVSATEREHYHGLRHPQRSRQYLASRWLLRAHLAHLLDRAPTDVPLEYAAQRPPMLSGSTWQISVSHSGLLCLCVVSNGLLTGCDVERHRPRRHIRAIAGQYFHPAESSGLGARPNGSALADFYAMWTLKEATLKSLGLGLAGGLRTPAFSPGPPLQCLDVPRPGPWTFASATRPCGNEIYSIALALGAVIHPRGAYRYSPGPDGRPEREYEPIDWRIATSEPFDP